MTSRNYQDNKLKPVSLPKGKKLQNPFFAYGIFKKNQLAYSKIEKYVNGNPITKYIPRRMEMRDGIPIINDTDNERYKTKGDLIYFKEEYQKEAYSIICKTEPDVFYKWQEIKIGEVNANVLVSINDLGSHYIEDNHEREDYNGRNDPYFKELIDVIDEYLNPEPDYQDYRPHDYQRRYSPEKNFFKLQMYYMLLWSAIERYCSLKYDIDNSIGKNNILFSLEKSFKKSLKRNVTHKRKVYSAKDAKEFTLDPDKPKDSIRYYYTVRCNAVHRGKSVRSDNGILRESLKELFYIFKDVLDNTFNY